MNKIFFKKQLVKLGDIVDYYDANIPVTQEFIDNNPDLFEIVDDVPEYVKYNEEIYKVLEWTCHCYCRLEESSDCKHPVKTLEPFKDLVKRSTKEAYERQELLKKAKRRYPKGTKFKSCISGSVKEVTQELHWSVCKNGHEGIEPHPLQGWVYHNGVWAEKLKKLFTTEDGVDIFEGDDYWLVKNNSTLWQELPIHCDNYGNPKPLKSFSTKEAAQKYIDNNKPKTIEITLEEIADKFNTDVKLIKIIK